MACRFEKSPSLVSVICHPLTIPRARMGHKPIRPKAEWAIDSEAMRARGTIVLVKSN